MRSLHVLAIVGLVVANAACAPSCGAPSSSTPAEKTPATEGIVDASGPRVRAPPAPQVDAAAAIVDAATSLDAAAARGPWEGLPAPSRSTRALDVRFEVVRRRSEDGVTSPVMLSIPSLRLEREIYDDRVSAPACTSRESEEHNAVLFSCSSMDGGVRVRAYQDGDQLVVDVTNAGDVPPALNGTHRFDLPAGRRVKFYTRFPAVVRR